MHPNIKLKYFEILQIAEYYRFLRIQKECRSKWQATIDKLEQLTTQRDNLTLEKAELNKKLKHASRMWATERQARQKIEKESNFLVSITLYFGRSTSQIIRLFFQIFRKKNI